MAKVTLAYNTLKLEVIEKQKALKTETQQFDKGAHMIIQILSGISKPDPKIAQLYQKQIYNIKKMREFIESESIV